ncbi:MAG: hypothetical protein SOZ58_02400 [Prevotella sp.]|nr:hypothetical protein [Prevotella sp.]
MTELIHTCKSTVSGYLSNGMGLICYPQQESLLSSRLVGKKP